MIETLAAVVIGGLLTGVFTIVADIVKERLGFRQRLSEKWWDKKLEEYQAMIKLIEKLEKDSGEIVRMSRKPASENNKTLEIFMPGYQPFELEANLVISDKAAKILKDVIAFDKQMTSKINEYGISLDQWYSIRSTFLLECKLKLIMEARRDLLGKNHGYGSLFGRSPRIVIVDD